MVTYSKFIKNASEYMDVKDIPAYVAEAAYGTYNKMPVKTASVIVKAYDESKSVQEKVAFEMIGANFVKESTEKKAFAPLIAAAGRLLMHPMTHVAMSVGSMAMNSMSKQRGPQVPGGVPSVFEPKTL